MPPDSSTSSPAPSEPSSACASPCPRARIGHAEVEIDAAALMLSDPMPPDFPANRALIYLYVADVDRAYGSALKAGATSIDEPADQFYGDRLARITDPYNNHWSIATHIEDLTPDQVAQRLAEMGEG